MDNVAGNSHINALAIDYLRFGVFSVVNNLWTWIAVVTAAAFSLWKVKNSSCSPRCSVAKAAGVTSCYSVEPHGDAVAEEERRSSSLETSPALQNTAAVAETDCCSMVFGATKGKIVVFFGDEEEEKEKEEDDVGGGRDGEGDVATDVAGEVVAGEWGWSGWERVLCGRKGETAWYRCQDLTFINGNVVRLWDDVRGR